MKVAELKQELRRRGEVTTGNKQQLVQKLKKLLKAEALATDDDSDNSYNSDDAAINLKRPTKDCRPRKNSYLKLLNYIQRLESKVRFLEISLSKFKKRTERGILSEHKIKGENVSNNAVPITNNGAAVISELRYESQQKETKNKILIISDTQGRDISKMAKKKN
ncbi:SAP domain [Popillia japonica]|uniref:SAP domain n=1 Tax=Popillia japonica TaxID=7064 RepID=A0AAW1IZ19_POPJA